MTLRALCIAGVHFLFFSFEPQGAYIVGMRAVTFSASANFQQKTKRYGVIVAHCAGHSLVPRAMGWLRRASAVVGEGKTAKISADTPLFSR
ncbi:MAG TPA: hypothetical protein VM782_17955 [Stellaceae bacterium]|nr:hypothetical protein [Stellaceae bacterium]